MRNSKTSERKSTKQSLWYEASSGNVYRDLGHTEEEAANLLLRGSLMIEIASIIEERGWSQAEAAQALKVSQPRVSELITGRISKFSVDLLLKYLMRLGKDVSFVLKDRNHVA